MTWQVRFDFSYFKPEPTNQTQIQLNRCCVIVASGWCRWDVHFTLLLGKESLPLCPHVHAEGSGNELFHFQPPAKSNTTRWKVDQWLCVLSRTVLEKKKCDKWKLSEKVTLDRCTCTFQTAMFVFRFHDPLQWPPCFSLLCLNSYCVIDLTDLIWSKTDGL